MIKVLRKHRNWLMIVIAILALPFCLYFVKSDTSLIRSDTYVQMYGRKVTLIEARRMAGLYQVAKVLGMSELTDGLAPGTGTEDQKMGSFVIDLLLLRHEADRLGIQPSEEEIIQAIRTAPELQGPSGFDATKYDQLERNILPSFGFTDEELRELARDAISVKRIKGLVTSGVTLPETEVKSQFDEGFSKNFVSVIRFHSTDFGKDIKPSDDEIKKYYDAHKGELKTEEKRKVEFVRLALTDDQKKLKDKERIDALQKLANTTNDVSQALVNEKGADFHQVAQKFQLPVDSTGEFTHSAPDPKLKADPQLNQVAFKLTKEEPTSDPIQTTDGFVILHLVGITEARPLSLDEAKPKIVDQIKSQRGRELVTTKGKETSDALHKALQSGKPLPAALQETGGLKPEKLEPFTLVNEGLLKNPPEKPKEEATDMMMIKNVTSQLKPGEVSEFFPWADGGFITILEKREPADPAKYQQAKTVFEESYDKNTRDYIFVEWLRDRQHAADIRFPPTAKG